MILRSRMLVAVPMVAVFTLAVFVATPGVAFAQWRLADGGTTCFNVITSGPVSGALVRAPRQTLQQAVGTAESVYVDAAGGDLAVGDKLEFIRNTGTIKHPATNQPFGEVVEVLGVGEVVDTNSDTALVRVISACQEIEAGDVMRPLVLADVPDMPRLPVFDGDRVVVPADADAFVVLGAVESVRTSTRDLTRKGMIEYTMYGQRDLLVIDQGSAESWAVGDVAMVYRDRVYEASDLFANVFDEPPLLGRGVIVRADVNSAIIQLTDTILEVQIGDRVRKVGNVQNMSGESR